MAPSSPTVTRSEATTPPLLPPGAPLTPSYIDLLATAIHSDGCTLVSEIYHDACVVHDLGYKYGIDPWGRAVSRSEIDRNFRLQMQKESKLGKFSPVSWIRWAGVRVFGGLFRRRADA